MVQLWGDCITYLVAPAGVFPEELRNARQGNGVRDSRQRLEVGRQLLKGQPGDLMWKAALRMEVIQKAVSRQMVSKAGTDVTLH